MPVVDPVEARNDQRHRRIAALIRCDLSVLNAARATLERWLARDAHQLDSEDMARFLESTPDGPG